MKNRGEPENGFSSYVDEVEDAFRENIQDSIQEGIKEAVPNSGQEKGAMSLLRISTVLLAMVSFWATAQGMKEYVFAQAWQAYAASLAIQGILLGLNFYLPTFWRKMNLTEMKRSQRESHGVSNNTTAKGRLVNGFLKKAGLLSLTGVVLFCSSWFSFVYIVGSVYGVSWGVESRLLIQSTYRQELYNASDYVNSYEDFLRNTLNNQILNLYSQAKALGKAELEIGKFNIEAERADYAAAGAAASTMESVLNALGEAMQENASAGAKERAMEIVVEMRGNMETMLSSLTEQISRANEDAIRANENVQRAQARLNNAPSEVDTTSHIAAIDTAVSILQRSQERLQDLQQQRDDYQRALDRIRYYEISLGLASSGSSELISASLRMIQQELFKDDPDLENLETQTVNIFQQLQAASNADDNNGQDYMLLLRDTNTFIEDLRKYRSLRTAGVQLDKWIEGMRTNAEVLVSNDSSWKEDWSERLDGLKSLVGSLPAYSGESDSDSNTLLLQYDRAKSSDNLDSMIRLYIANHNAAQQGLIYLFDNPHPGLAWFSLLLAFFLDIAAFTTGLLIDIISRYDSQFRKAQTVNSTQTPYINIRRKQSVQTKKKTEKILTDSRCASANEQAASRYIYLTGDYIYINDKYIYSGIEQGVEKEYPISGVLLNRGMYFLAENADFGKSESFLCVEERKELVFLEGRQDGIYLNCQIKYEDGALSILEKTVGANDDQGNKFSFLANADADVPVFLLGETKGENSRKLKVMTSLDQMNDTAQQIAGLQSWISLAIIGLNQKGSRIAGVYLIYQL